MMLRLLPILVFALVGSACAAQEAHQIGTSSRGRVADRSIRLNAQELARRIGLDCEVVDAVLIGRDERGAPQYEVSCVDGPGYRLVGGSRKQAFNCLALASQPASRAGPSACRLPANRDGAPVVAGMALEAGLACRVDQGAMVGLSPARMPIYEAGCAGAAGAWLEQTGDGWSVTDCMAVTARGDVCRFTTSDEQLTTFRGWLAGSSVGDCAPSRIRYMGEGATGPLYEAACDGRDGLVVRLDPARTVLQVIPCADAAGIGDGCRLSAEPVRTTSRP